MDARADIGRSFVRSAMCYSGPGEPASIKKLLAQIRDMLQILSADEGAQLDWIFRERVPVDEIAIQFLDAVPAWLPRIEEARALTPETIKALLDVREVLERFLTPERRRMWLDTGLGNPDWEIIRQAAANVLEQLPIT